MVGEFLPHEDDVARCSGKLLDSTIFAEHGDYVRRQIVHCLLQVGGLHGIFVARTESYLGRPARHSSCDCCLSALRWEAEGINLRVDERRGRLSSTTGAHSSHGER